MGKQVFLLYRCDAWMSNSSKELIGAFDETDEGDLALSETVRDELCKISHGDDFDPDELGVRKCFGKYVKKELEAAREAKIDEWQDYFFEHDQTPSLRTNLYLEAVTLNEVA